MALRAESISKVLEIILKLSSENKLISVDEVSDLALISRDQVRKILEALGVKAESLQLAEAAKIEAILNGLKLGVDGGAIARYLSWREFEKLVTRILEGAGYDAEWNLTLSHGRERIQIDVLAYNGSLLLLVDCKRWNKPLPPSAEESVREGQERRMLILKEIVENLSWRDERHLIYLTPLVLSLYQPSKPLLGGHVFASIRNLGSAIEFIERSYFQLRHELLRVPRGLTLKELILKLKGR